MIMDILKIKKNELIVSRAGTAVYLILKANRIEGRKVIVPANLCYAAIYPILYSGNEPLFVDVSYDDGNVTYREIEEAVCKAADTNRSGDIAAAILPHMYGNTISDIEKICGFLRENDIISIEDCASAMGAEIVRDKAVRDASESKMFCGSVGDYGIFSTGYSKTIDVGGGGIIISDNDLSEESRLYAALDEKQDIGEINDSFFSKLYRLIRNTPQQTLTKAVWSGLADAMRPTFIFHDSEIEQKMIEALPELPGIIRERREKCTEYDSLIHYGDTFRRYNFHDGAAPWRFNLWVCENRRNDVVSYLLENKVPVSDWYPAVTPIFGIDASTYPNAEKMGNTILNFPLLIEDDEIKRICKCINDAQRH